MYGTDWTENVAPDEAARFELIAKKLAALQANRNEKYGERGRALHRQAIAGVQARFVVRPDLADVLPIALHVGPFQPGAAYDAFVRFSNGGWDRPRKDTPDVRAVAIKLLGVTGPKCLGSADTQDFLLNHTRARTPRTPEEFAALIEAAAPGGTLGTIWRLIQAVGVGRALAMVKGTLDGFKVPFSSFASGTFWSMSPFQLGPSAAMFSLAGVENAESRPGGLTADLASRLKEGAAFSFRVQLYENATATPIEDPTVVWETPFIEVARLEIPPTELTAPESVETANYIENLSFDPWHAVEALRPLGAFNRARKVAYYAGSVQHREVIPDDEVRPR
ncbi:catalase [Deltaproteobacteria bacterium]|nr:catalase [Deltaproteobacteria bacterium]